MVKYNEENTVLNTDAWDYYTFNGIYETADKFKQNVDSIAKDNNERFGLVGDIFSSLYKSVPILKRDLSQNESIQSPQLNEGDMLKQLMDANNIATINNIPPAEKPNEAMMQKILSHKEYEKLHINSKGDKLFSSIGTMQLGEEVQAWFTEQEKKDKNFKKTSDEHKQAQAKFDKLKNKMQQSLDEGKTPTNAQKEKLQQAKEQLNQSNQQMTDYINGHLGQDELGNIIAKSAEKASDTKEGVESLLGGAGMGDEELKKLPLSSQLALADMLRNNSEVKKMAEMAGKFKKIARKKQKQKHTESVDRNGVTVGNQVERLLPQELAMYTNDATKLDFMRRFSEGETMMFSPEGKETLGKGALIVILDESSSIYSLNGQAKGFVIALAMIAKKQKRDLVVIPFANLVGTETICKKGKVTTENIISWATNFIGGGTQYTPALKKAQAIIQEKSPFKKADIIFVTDGAPTDKGALEKALPSFKDFKKEKAVSVYSLLIGQDAKEEYVKQFSDKVIKASSFLDESAASILAI